MNQIVIINDDLCIGCGICAKICPTKILYIDKTINKCKITDETKCGKSGCCEKNCPQNAIKIIK